MTKSWSVGQQASLLKENAPEIEGEVAPNEETS